MQAVDGQRSDIRVLIVEDRADAARTLTLELERSSGPVTYERVASAQEMKRALLGADWDLVLCARTVPDFGPEAALAVLKSSGRDAPLVVHGGRVPHQPPAPVLHPGAAGGDRADFLRLAGEALADAAGEGQSVVCMVDIAHAARVREILGAAIGDALLAQSHLRLRGLADGGLAARVGDTEFAVLRTGLQGADAVERYVEGLSAALARPYSHAGLELHVAAHMGASLCGEGARALPQRLANAETALEQCRRLMGRDAFLFHFPEMRPLRAGAVLREAALFHALRGDELRLYYQPCVSVLTGRVTNVEALVRWHHPELGLLGPDRFIPLAHDCGLMSDIDAWVLREAAWQSRLWRVEGHGGFTVGVNISPGELAYPRLLERTAMALRETGIAADALEIEITEAALAHDTPKAIAALEALRRLGVRIAIDDFGTGFSSLGSLKRCPVDILKIDRSFVRNIALDQGDAGVAQTIIGLARNLDLTVHAEGVETAQQLEILADRGCDRAQGYLFARPVPAEQLIPLIRSLEARAQAAPARALALPGL